MEKNPGIQREVLRKYRDREIIENTPNVKWGCGTSERPGENRMGKILMKLVRDMENSCQEEKAESHAVIQVPDGKKQEGTNLSRSPQSTMKRCEDEVEQMQFENALRPFAQFSHAGDQNSPPQFQGRVCNRQVNFQQKEMTTQNEEMTTQNGGMGQEHIKWNIIYQ